MSSTVVRPSGIAGLGDLVTLSNPAAAANAVVAPARGAIVTSFSVGGYELLYMDDATLNDASKNVRGGIPILFPSPGKLEGDTYRWHGATGGMKQHGFARNVAWSVAPIDENAASVTLLLEPDDATRAQYPWDFRVVFRVSLRGSTLDLDVSVGFHPYFRVDDKARTRIDASATRAFDNVTKRERPFTGFDLSQPEVDLHLLDHAGSKSALHLADGARIDVTGSPDFVRWVVWALAGKDFVCLEPWTAGGNALNTGEHVTVLSPGEARTSAVRISYAR
jgi:galactose mutarotase-like enzyme